MRGWNHRDHILADVNANAQAFCVDIRKMVDQAILRQVPAIEPKIIISADFQFVVDRPGHDISWGE